MWDHAIELKEGSPNAVDCKVYPLNQTEDLAVHEFINKELGKEYPNPLTLHLSSS